MSKNTWDLNAAALDEHYEMVALLRQIVQDWPQVGTDDDMNGGDAVDVLCDYVQQARSILKGYDNA